MNVKKLRFLNFPLGKIKQIIVLLMILVFVAQPVSAGFFEDIFNKITGRVTENVTAEPEPNITEPDTIPDEEMPSPPEPECTDSDGGKDYYVKGETETREGNETVVYYDTCHKLYDSSGNLIGYTGNLTEHYCEEGKVAWESYKCPNDCSEGACLPEETNCTDSDGGLEYYVKGTLTSSTRSGTDYCHNSNVLYEMACIESTPYFCPNGCQDGACIGEPPEILPSNVSPKTSPPFVMAVWDRAPTSDIILISSVAQDLQEAGYVVATKLFSEINALTDNRMILALYDKEAVIIVREDAPSHAIFLTELKSILNQNGITNIRDLSSSDLKSSNLADLFGVTPVPPREDGMEVIECEKSVPLETHENCELEGGDLVIRRDDEGCIRFVECVKRGNIDVIYEEIEEIPSATKLLSIALKLESLKIEFDQMIRKLRGIVNYYEGTGNTAEAEKFRKVLGLFSNANDKVEEIKARLREKVSDMTEEDLKDIKHDIKYISEVIMQDALYIILGGEIEIEGSKGVTEEGYIDCGDDSKCLDEALRICEPAVFRPAEDLLVKIKGLQGEVCILEATFQDDEMVCKIKDYATVRSENRNFMQYCKGKGLSVFKFFKATITTSADWTLMDCLKMTDSNRKEGCYMAVASKTGDTSLCEKVTDSNRKESCYMSAIWNIRDASLCAEIPDKGRKYDCYIRVAERTKDVSVCEKITESDGKESCYTGVAVATSDVSLCEKMSDGNKKGNCFFQLARTTNDISLCEKITPINPSRNPNCYTTVAINTKDSSICEKITEDDEKAICYAFVSNDASVCERITVSMRKDYCYSHIATETKDSSLCEKITLSHMRDECYADATSTAKKPAEIERENYEEAREIIRRPEAKGEVVFTDDFEGGTENWIFHDENGNWSTVVEDGNTVLKLTGVVGPELQKEWDNYLFRFRFKRIDGAMHVNFRKTSPEGGQKRYFVSISDGVNNLVKHVNESWQKLDYTYFGFDENWHTLEIRGYDNLLNVYLDDELLYKYKDTESPLLSGRPGFEIHKRGLPITPEFLIDDVEIQITSEEDIIGGVS